jgi:hypothetical protein
MVGDSDPLVRLSRQVYLTSAQHSFHECSAAECRTCKFGKYRHIRIRVCKGSAIDRESMRTVSQSAAQVGGVMSFRW